MTCELKIILHPNIPVEVRGCFSQVDVVDVTSDINLRLLYGSVGLFDTTGRVTALTAPEGRIVYTGSKGHLILRSAGNIDLKVSEHEFDGSIEAMTTSEPVRIAVPAGFRTPFEAIGKEVICRADLRSQIEQFDEGTLHGARYGSQTPSLRLRSDQGPVVIDNWA